MFEKEFEMKEYTAEELGVIIAKHRKWLDNEVDGERADLTSANLTSANLRYADLRYADLTSANLTSADLTSADLRNVGGREINTFLSVAGIGRKGRQTLWWVEEDIVWCGCFKGTMDEFEVKVDVQHGDSTHGQNYRDAIAYFRGVASRLKKNEEKGV